MAGAVDHSIKFRSQSSKSNILSSAAQRQRHAEPDTLRQTRAIHLPRNSLYPPGTFIISSDLDRTFHDNSSNHGNTVLDAHTFPVDLASKNTNFVRREFRLTLEDMTLDGSRDKCKATDFKGKDVPGMFPSHETTVSDGSSSWDRSSYGGDLTQDERSPDGSMIGEHFRVASSSVNSWRVAKPSVKIDSDTPRYVLRMLNPKSPHITKQTKPALQFSAGALREPTVSVDSSPVNPGARESLAADSCESLPNAAQALKNIGKRSPRVKSLSCVADRNSLVNFNPESSTPSVYQIAEPDHTGGSHGVPSRRSIEIKIYQPLNAAISDDADEILIVEQSSNLEIGPSSHTKDRFSSQQRLLRSSSDASLEIPIAQFETSSAIVNVAREVPIEDVCGDSKTSQPEASTSLMCREFSSSREQLAVPIDEAVNIDEDTSRQNPRNLNYMLPLDHREDCSLVRSRISRALPKSSLVTNSNFTSNKKSRTTPLYNMIFRSEQLLRKLSRRSISQDRDISVAASDSQISHRGRLDDDLTVEPILTPQNSRPQSVEAARQLIKQMMTIGLGSLATEDRNLNARPPRNSRHLKDGSSPDTSAEPTLETFVSEEKLAETCPTTGKSLGAELRAKSFDGECLERIILEIESVLKEALSIAQQAAENEERERSASQPETVSTRVDNLTAKGNPKPMCPDDLPNPGLDRPQYEEMVKKRTFGMPEKETEKVRTQQTTRSPRGSLINEEVIDGYHRTLTWLKVLPKNHDTSPGEKIGADELPLQAGVLSIEDDKLKMLNLMAINRGSVIGVSEEAQCLQDAARPTANAKAITNRRTSHIEAAIQATSDGGGLLPTQKIGSQSIQLNSLATNNKHQDQLPSNTITHHPPFPERPSLRQYQLPLPAEVSDIRLVREDPKGQEFSSVMLGRHSKIHAEDSYPPPPISATAEEPNEERSNDPQRRLYPSATLMRKGVKMNQKPMVQLRGSSVHSQISKQRTFMPELSEIGSSGQENDEGSYAVDFAGYHHSDEQPHRGCRGYNNHGYSEDDGPGILGESTGITPDTFGPAQISHPPMRSIPDRSHSKQEGEPDEAKDYSLNGRHHHSIKGFGGFSLSRAHRKSPIARDWSNLKKRGAAGVACMSTALVGFIVGVYAGQVPAIQYIIVDENTHYAILGNVVFYLGLAVSTAFCWPLPLMYGRKPFVVMSLAVVLALQFPQALVVETQRSPLVTTYRVGLLLPRAAAGFVMGFANVNFFATLLDLFGASLQSGNPHQEILNEYDVRRHGGGMGVWLSIWTFCYIGSIGLGFFFGAILIAYLEVSWGFWLIIILTLVVLLGNVISPEVRRSAYRNSLAEVQDGPNVSRRIGRGEVMMHLYSTGPIHWYEEMLAGSVLCWRMLKQPGFAILVLYQGWIYGQVVMVMILLGALVSKYYFLLPQFVALCVGAFPIGAFLAIPFQKASLFSRARHHPQRTDSATFEKRVNWSSHLIRRSLFMVTLPFAGLAYTLSSGGTDTPIALPIFFSALIGFLSNLALSECTGIIMETFDVSDLQPGMTGRPRNDIPESARNQRTNFSSFPRISAAFAAVQTCSFIIAAIATAMGGTIERQLGAQTATAVVAGVLLVMTLLLVATLTRARTVQIVPTHRAPTAILSGPGEDLPVIIGHPSGKTRRISLLEMGDLTRWTEIRRKNGLLGGHQADNGFRGREE